MYSQENPPCLFIWGVSEHFFFFWRDEVEFFVNLQGVLLHCEINLEPELFFSSSFSDDVGFCVTQKERCQDAICTTLLCKCAMCLWALSKCITVFPCRKNSALAHVTCCGVNTCKHCNSDSLHPKLNSCPWNYENTTQTQSIMGIFWILFLFIGCCCCIWHHYLSVTHYLT